MGLFSTKSWSTSLFAAVSLCLLSTNHSFAVPAIGTEKWNTIYNSSVGYHFGAFQAVDFRSDGKIIVSGYEDGQNSDAMVLRYDSATGNTIDTPPEWISYNSNYDYFYDQAIGPNEDLYLAGRSQTDSQTDSPTLWKYDNSGTVVSGWPKVYTTGGYTGTNYAVGLDDLGNVYSAGNYNSNWLIQKFDPSGSAATGFPIEYDHSSLADGAQSLAVDSEGNVVVVGSVGVASDNNDWHVRKYAGDGTLLWTTSYDLKGLNELAMHVVVDSTDNIIVAGRINNGTDNSTGADYDWKIVKYNTNDGQVQWSQTWDDGTSRTGWAWGMVLDPKENIYIVGPQANSSGFARSLIQYRDGETGDLLKEQAINHPSTLNLLPASEHDYQSRLALREGQLVYSGYVWQGYVNYGRTGHIGMLELFSEVAPSVTGGSITPSTTITDVPLGTTLDFTLVADIIDHGATVTGSCPSGELNNNGDGTWDYTTGNIAADCTVIVTFASTETFSLSYDAGYNGTLLGAASQTVVSGQNGTAVTAVANPGYIFVRWDDDVTEATRTDSNIYADLSVTAEYQINPQDLSVAKLSAGADHTLVIRTDGTLWSWGYNDEGQIGDGSYGEGTNKSAPVQIGTDNNWSDIAGGSHHSLALKTDGTLWAWGGNYYGALGNGESGTQTHQTLPIQIGLSTDWAKIFARGTFSIALKTDGTLWGWGNNSAGQLGDGTTDMKTVPTPIGTDTWQSVSAGFYYCLGIKDNGTLWAWGSNYEGQLGIGSETNATLPVQIGQDSTWVEAYAGYEHSMAKKADGTLWAWGYNYFGQLGDGTTVDKNSPIQTSTAANWVSISLGAEHTIALTTDNKIWSWGKNARGQLGDGTTRGKTAPEVIEGDSNWRQIASGANHVVAVTQGGALSVWGSNLYNQLGDGIASPHITITPVQMGSETGWLSVYANGNITKSIKSDGTLWEWGKIYDDNSANLPTQKGVDTDWQSVEFGQSHTLALKDNNTLWAWGRNNNGQLGTGSNDDEEESVQIGSASWQAVAVGNYHNLGIQADGTLWAWGYNYRGQLGDGTTTDSNTPIQIGESTWTAVAAGEDFSLAIKSDGTLWAWGRNSRGQLGIGSWDDATVPTRVGSATDWQQIAAGGTHSLGLRIEGSGLSLWAWGYNSSGQLGVGNTINRSTPGKVGASLDWTTITGGRWHTVAMQTDGTLWTWGNNYEGQLGYVTPSSSQTSPSQVGSDTDWQVISAGEDHTIAIKSDTTLWSWGDNYYGQLGSGTSWSAFPIKIIEGVEETFATVTPSVTGNGTIDPATDQTVATGTAVQFTLTPAQNNHIENVSGTCPSGVLNDSGTGSWTYDIDTVVEDCSLIANFEIDSFTLNYTAGPGGSISGESSQTVTYDGNGLPVTATPATGYHFVNWSDGTGATTRTETNVTANFSATANFEIDTFTLTYAAGPNGSITGEPTQTVAYNTSGTAVTAVPAIGYEFVSWSDNVLTATRSETNVTTHLSVTANFTHRTFTLTYSPGENGTIDGELSQTVNYGGSGTVVTATPAIGFYFVRWSDGETSATRQETNVTANFDLTANWAVLVPIACVTSISAGGSHVAMVKPDGTLWSWGDNDYGQLGNGSTTHSTVQTQVGDETSWKSVTAGDNHTIALKHDGTLWSFGANNYGGLGDGTTTNSSIPVAVGTAAGWETVELGDWHSIALKDNGSLWAWGANHSGQLGDGTTSHKSSPVQIGNETDWESIASGRRHSVAVKSDGTLWGWGENSEGQLGDGTTVNKYTPTQLGTDTDWQAISAGMRHTVAIKTDGTLWVWGQSADEWTYQTAPHLVGTDTWKSISAGSRYSIGIQTDGTVWAWGLNRRGQLGDGTAIDRITPVPISIDTDWKSVSAGGSFTLLMKDDGALFVTGSNHRGQWGNGTEARKTSPTPSGTGNDWQAIQAGYGYSVALDQSGRIWASGDNLEYGTLGDGTDEDKATFIQIDNNSEWLSIFGGQYHTMAVKSDGSLWGWGRNGNGQVGDGTREDRNSPVKVSSATGWKNFALGKDYTLAIKDDNTLWGWGNGYYMGVNNSPSYTAPTQINSAEIWQAISGNDHHVLAIKTDGTLWGWGANTRGEIGDGSYVYPGVNHPIPVPIGIDTDWQSIAAGYQHSLAIKTDGTLWASGESEYGRLGNNWGGSWATKTLIKIGTDTDWQSIAAGGYHSIGMKIDGSLYGWGANFSGQVGDSTTTNRHVPTLVNSNTDWQGIAVGQEHSVAIKNGSLMVWGSNTFGQLGDGTAWRTTALQIIQGVSYNVTSYADTSGTIDPIAVQTVGCGDTLQFILVPNTGFATSIEGTCEAGLLTDNGDSSYNYLTGQITEDCTVEGKFHPFGDINHSGDVDLADAILALQMVSGSQSSSFIYINAEIGGNLQIGLDEAIFAMQQCIAEP